jgi:hypothetical protein
MVIVFIPIVHVSLYCMARRYPNPFNPKCVIPIKIKIMCVPDVDVVV